MGTNFKHLTLICFPGTHKIWFTPIHTIRTSLSYISIVRKIQEINWDGPMSNNVDATHLSVDVVSLRWMSGGAEWHGRARHWSVGQSFHLKAYNWNAFLLAVISNCAMICYSILYFILCYVMLCYCMLYDRMGWDKICMKITENLSSISDKICRGYIASSCEFMWCNESYSSGLLRWNFCHRKMAIVPVK